MATPSPTFPLGGLEQLSALTLGRNRVADISPLLESGLSGTESYVDLRGNPLHDGQADHVLASCESGTVVMFDDGGHRVPLFPSAATESSIAGFVTSLHDIAPRAADGSLWIPFFNLGSNRRQASRLRLVNWGKTATEATITGIDAGNSQGDAVRVPARSARDYMAWELETGEGAGLSGALGDGDGKWRLRVFSQGDIQAMSLLGLPTGHITNLSTTPRHPRE